MDRGWGDREVGRGYGYKFVQSNIHNYSSSTQVVLAYFFVMAEWLFYSLNQMFFLRAISYVL